MRSGHDANTQTGLDMANARRNTTIDVQLVRDHLHSGKYGWEMRQKVIEILSKDPVLSKERRLYSTRKQGYERALAIVNRLHELGQLHEWNPLEQQIALSLNDESLPIQLHLTAFEPVINSQGSAPLLSKYRTLIATKGIIGCYLQTELGHGTGVARLETTATYIPETREFEIHSPTLTSSKWWIGALGKTATHGVVQAKLILGSEDMGPHLFFVQLRSLDDHRLLPGITAGDIGPKAMGGYDSIDNGFARFNRVRIPKENMLSKFAQVADDGKYVKPPHAKLSYGGMLYIRQGMVITAGWTVARAATVSIRYATVRRQGEIAQDGLEPQVINHPSTYYRLLPILAHAYVFMQLGRDLSIAFQNMSQRLTTGDTSLLAEMHATTSGLKVLVTTTAIHDVEVSRRSMGGHGYSAYAGLGRLYADYVPSATYEGDNFVLDQQVVRAALKSFRNMRATTQPSESLLSPSTYYLRLLFMPNATPHQLTDSSWANPADLKQALEWRTALIVQEAARNTENPDASVNQRVSKAVTEAFIASQVAKFIEKLSLPGKERQALSDLFMLYLLTTVEAALVDLYSFGIIRASEPGQDPSRGLRIAINTLCQSILPNAIALTDAFGFTDWELDSALGVYDGKVYEALWNKVQTEPLNATEVTDAYQASIKPMLQRGQAMARQLGAKL